MPIKLLEPPVCGDTIKVLEELLEDARRGVIRGVAFVAIEARYVYTADAVGLALKNPTFTRGALLMLGTRLAELFREHQQ